MQAFFRLDLAGAARAIAAADAALGGQPADAATWFARSLHLALGERLVPIGGSVPFELRHSWPVEGTRPDGLELELSIAATNLRLPVDGLPRGGNLPLTDTPAGDHELRWRLLRGDVELCARTALVSVVAERDTRLAKLRAAADAAGDDLDGRSLHALARMLPAMTRGRAEETLLPGARLLEDAEALARALADGERHHGPDRPGDHWLRIPTADRTFAVRLFVPPTGDTPRPLVLALHGAGGSENLFFDGYGDGEAVRQCADRGFYLCAPRQGLGVPDLPALVDALAARWPIDRERVFLIGHSMGAAMAVANAAAAPHRFAGVAALGGGGDPGDAEAVRTLPFFVGVGSRDFLAGSARNLRDRLQALTTPLEWREYAGVEHLAIVQIALPDVFTWFDSLRN